VIDVRDFHKAFSGHIAAQGVTFRVEPGELLAIIGPNGAGKTTTMRAIAGIISANRGRISVAGYDVKASATDLPLDCDGLGSERSGRVAIRSHGGQKTAVGPS
jgi:ABC-type multidrug transport system ATPase subunit